MKLTWLSIILKQKCQENPLDQFIDWYHPSKRVTWLQLVMFVLQYLNAPSIVGNFRNDIERPFGSLVDVGSAQEQCRGSSNQKQQRKPVVDVVHGIAQLPVGQPTVRTIPFHHHQLIINLLRHVQYLQTYEIQIGGARYEHNPGDGPVHFVQQLAKGHIMRPDPDPEGLVRDQYTSAGQRPQVGVDLVEPGGDGNAYQYDEHIQIVPVERQGKRYVLWGGD